jgi:hypothetical protein
VSQFVLWSSQISGGGRLELNHIPLNTVSQLLCILISFLSDKELEIHDSEFQVTRHRHIHGNRGLQDARAEIYTVIAIVLVYTDSHAQYNGQFSYYCVNLALLSLNQHANLCIVLCRLVVRLQAAKCM